MKRIFQLWIVYIIATSALFAQKSMTIDDAVVGIYRNFYIDSYKLYRFRGNDKITFFSDQAIQELQPDGKGKPVLTLTDLNPVLKNNGYDEIAYIPDYNWLTEQQIKIDMGNGIFTYDIKSKKVICNIKYEDDAENMDYCKESMTVAYTKKNNLYLKNNEGKTITITNDADENIVNGKSVHREEFGIEKGTFWSPNGNFLAFYRMDQTMVTDYPLVDITTRIAEEAPVKYPMAGMKSHQVTVGIYDMKAGKTLFLKTGEPVEQYLTNIAWSPDEKSVYIAVLNREQNHMKFNQYDVATGNFVKTLFEETNDRYVEPLVPIAFLKTKPNQFIWQSQRDGYNHLYLYDTDGKVISQLTKGNFVVKRLIGFDTKYENVFIEATLEKKPIETHLFKVNIATAKMTQITKKEGMHEGTLNEAGTSIIDNYSAIKIPLEINLLSADGTSNKNLFKAKDPLKEYKLGSLDIVTIKAADGKTDLYGALIKPPDFDAAKKYPVILYVYGGPHAQMVDNSWNAGQDLWKFYMAQKGYVVFVMDNRGSGYRGFEFESVIHRNLGVNEMADQMKGIDYLKQQPWVDVNRIGVHGWSYGGFMTTSLMTAYPEIFKVGVAGGPVIDWKYYEVMYGERYMDMPEENPEGYEKSSLLNKVTNLKGKLMIIHGAMDHTVVWQNSLQFIQKCIENKVQVDYFVYPLAEHNVRGIDRVHLMQKITQYFDDYLMPIK